MILKMKFKDVTIAIRNFTMYSEAGLYSVMSDIELVPNISPLTELLNEVGELQILADDKLLMDINNVKVTQVQLVNYPHGVDIVIKFVKI